MVNSQYGLSPGMKISIPGNVIIPKIGDNCELIIRFFLPDNSPLFANQSENNFRDINGMVSVSTEAFPMNQHINTGIINLFIPYYALNHFRDGIRVHELKARGYIYINNQIATVSSDLVFNFK